STGVDVGVQNEPVQDPAGLVPHGKAANVTPSVLTIDAPDAMDELVRLAQSDRLFPRCDNKGKVVRMNHVAGLPVFQLVERPTDIVQSVPVDERDLAIGGRHGDECGNTVDDLAERELAIQIVPGFVATFEIGGPG